MQHALRTHDYVVCAHSISSGEPDSAGAALGQQNRRSRREARPTSTPQHTSGTPASMRAQAPRAGAPLLAVLLLACCADLSTARRPGNMLSERASTQQAAQQQAVVGVAQRRRLVQDEVAVVEDKFAAAPSCRSLPTAATATPDVSGRLWGWSGNASCAFKDVAGHVLFYLNYAPASWLHTPACKMPAFPESSVADSKYKVWGWDEAGSLCAFKDDQQQPIPIQKTYRRLAWPETPACVQDPTPTAANAVPDNNGCLWGWQLDRNCAFKHPATSAPLYYAGYTRTCDVAASVLKAAEFNDKMAGGSDTISAAQGDVLPIPGANAPLPVTGQKGQAPEYEPEAVEQLFDTNAAADKKGVKRALMTAQPQTQTPARPSSTAPAQQRDLPAAAAAPAAPVPDQQPTARLLMQSDGSDVSDPRYPKKRAPSTAAAAPTAAAFPRGWIDGGPGGLTPPRHRSRSTLRRTPLLPESRMQDNAISAAEGGQERVTHAPVDASKIPEATGDCGLGGITPPGTAAKGGVLCVAEVTAAASDGVFTVAEAPSEVAAQPSSGILPLGHAVDLNGVPAEAHRRRRLLQASTAAAASSAGSFASAVATSSGTATAIATADGTSSTNGTALAVSRAAATDNSTAVAVSNATSVGNSTVTAVANANATDGGTAVAQSAVEGKGGQDTSVVVDAQAHGANKSCVLSLSAASGKFYWSCSEAPGTPAATPTPTGQLEQLPAPPANNSAAPTSNAGPVSPSAAAPANASDSPAPAAANVAAAPGPLSYDVLARSWTKALVCRVQPNKTNSVQDPMGRLWGFEADTQQACAFRKLDGSTEEYAGYIPISFATAPACSDEPSSGNSMSDKEGRLWGWDGVHQENCAFKNPSSGEPAFFAGYVPHPVAENAAVDNARMLPSAAGPSHNDTATGAGGSKDAPSSDAALSAAEAADEDIITAAAVAQTKQIMAMLPPDASLRDKANAAARAALTVMVASDALTAAGDASAPNGRIKAAEADAGASSTQAEGGDVLRLRSAAAWMQHVAARVGPSLQGRR